jgi:two-component system, NarL family, sensor histidine kinase UhpB
MKILLSIFLLLCIGYVSKAQSADSLRTLILKSNQDSTKAILHSLLADELTKSNPKQAVETAREGLKLSNKIKFEKGIFENALSLASAFQGQALFDSAIIYFHRAKRSSLLRKDISGQAEVSSGLGHSFMRKSTMDSARFYLDQSLMLAKQVKNYRVEAGVYNNYGNVFLEESNYTQALDYFIKAAKLYENPLADEYGQCLALSNIGNIEYRLGNYEKALSYAQQSMAIARKKSFPSSIGYAHKLLGRIYRKLTKYDSALLEYKQAQLLYASLNDPRSTAEVLQNIGNIYFDKEQHQDALTNYKQSLVLAKSISAKPIIAFAYSAIGQANLILRKHTVALLYLDSACVAAKATRNNYLLMDTYAAISEVHEAMGNYEKALAIHKQFVNLKDSINQSENRQLTEETQAKYELEKKETRIILLEKDQELKSLALAKQQAIQSGIIIASILISAIAILLVNRYRIQNKAKRQTEIELMRNALARDLHDDIGSTLSTINIISKIAMRENPQGNNNHLTRISEQSSQMMESMSDMVWSINPINDSIEKIVVKMKVFAGEILEPKNINYQFIGEDSLPELFLNAEIRKNLFLLYKEALNNAAKYSEATHLVIEFRKLDNRIELTIADNGKGFIEEQAHNGNGLRNMRSRAASLMAEFKLTTSPNEGTRIDVSFPIT